jgi:hypothetical protein
MAYFAPEMVCYVDATPGWDFDSYAALKTVRHYADALLREFGGSAERALTAARAVAADSRVAHAPIH